MSQDHHNAAPGPSSPLFPSTGEIDREMRSVRLSFIIPLMLIILGGTLQFHPRSHFIVEIIGALVVCYAMLFTRIQARRDALQGR